MAVKLPHLAVNILLLLFIGIYLQKDTEKLVFQAQKILFGE